jgi:hypothetical protein
MAGHGNHTEGELGRLACANRADNLLAAHDASIATLTTSVASRQTTAQKNQANGYAGIGSDGKIPLFLLPTVESSGNSWEAADEAEMLALEDAIPGDLVWREDTLSFWQLKVTGPETLANWRERTEPIPGVTSINGTLTGNVPNVQLTTQKGVANGYASLDSGGKVPVAQMPADSGIISHINEYHKYDIRRYGAIKNTDCTNAILSALADAQAEITAGQKGQNGSTGAFQDGAQLNGGADIEIPIGTWFCGNIDLSHRVGIGGKGQGSILKRLAGQAGNWIENRRDGSVHAKYCNIHDLKLHGNKNAASAHPTGTAVRFLGETAYDAAAYKNPLDEDYDEHHGMWNVHMIMVDGDGLRVEGSGEFKGYNVTIRDVTGVGLWTWQDNQFDMFSIGHTGLEGAVVAGDKCVFTNFNAWYNGEVDSSHGQGLRWEADSGAISGAVIQDTYAQGAFFNGARNVAVSGLSIDSASKSGAGTYAGLDIWDSSWLNFAAVTIRNRFRTDGSTGPCRDGVKIGGGAHHLFGDLVANTETNWGMTAALKSGSVAGTGSALRLNGSLIANS